MIFWITIISTSFTAFCDDHNYSTQLSITFHCSRFCVSAQHQVLHHKYCWTKQFHYCHLRIKGMLSYNTEYLDMTGLRMFSNPQKTSPKPSSPMFSLSEYAAIDHTPMSPPSPNLDYWTSDSSHHTFKFYTIYHWCYYSEWIHIRNLAHTNSNRNTYSTLHPQKL